MMESMSLGVPVIATGWSGNMDFMTDENSLPVDFRLVPVNVDASSPYAVELATGRAVWAQAGVDDAAAKMRRLYLDEDERRRLGERARVDMQERKALVERAEFIGELRALDRERIVASDGHRARAAALRAIETQQLRKGLFARPYRTLRWAVGDFLRARGLR